MADSTLHPASHVSAGRPYIALSNGMQAFYARRGMWRDGAPAGMLAQWLGERCPWKPYYGGAVHWTSPEGLRELHRDASEAPPQAWPTHHQRAQYLRRLREAGERAGLPCNHCTGDGAQPAAVANTVAAPPAARRPADPFRPLTIPPAGTRAHAAFVRHLADVTRDFVDFTQGSAYTGGAAP